ncbi:alpha-amylase [Tardibacter chloracetimidivorans]|uniref:Alpha-amylase n=1 Tax=Tardibacter chloracetimidivorans TaxID=1921510 RepID=A0A1L3ZTN3_9SPHN|nr:alpha-amylase family glycosyl hydrolase [Tardibacter chloracetimidivorans]API58949.1 alpha-amylase [Tardibacter chloracetimidivorans]
MTKRWWEGGCVYQIYPRSFQDSDGDGVGDLSGIARRLDHLVDLGVDAVWLSPVYPSPMADFGYDVADYRDIDPMFGTLADFDALIAAVHQRGLKLLMDFVPNHSSDRHPWFVESRSSRASPKRDWYIWRDPAPGGGPPNNWTSDFGGSAWEYDGPSDQYYLHAFLKEQPDLNWRNPDVRAAMLDAMRFWLDRGVDGFRIDVLWHIVKAAGLPDNPLNPDYHPTMGEKFKVLQLHSTDQPETHEIIREMRRIADSYDGGDERVLIGEIFLPLPRLMAYYGNESDGVHLPFNFQLVESDWHAEAIARFILDYEAALPAHGWPNWVTGSHDAKRMAARVGEAQARVAAMLLLTLRGTPTLYQGDEIGIGEVTIPPDQLKDPRELREPGLGLGRDPSRTPMAWDASLNGGFSEGTPWLPLHSDWQSRNVEAQLGDTGSMLHLYRRLLRLRRGHPALSIGECADVRASGDVLSYDRHHEGEHMRIILNLSGRDQPLPVDVTGFRPLLTTIADGQPVSPAGGLRADEGLLLIMDGRT